jgi:hypothetical protein
LAVLPLKVRLPNHVGPQFTSFLLPSQVEF